MIVSYFMSIKGGSAEYTVFLRFCLTCHDSRLIYQLVSKCICMFCYHHSGTTPTVRVANPIVFLMFVPLFFVLLFCLVCLLLDETQIWPGDLRVCAGVGSLLVGWIGFAAECMTTVLCTEFNYIAASLSVRTEPKSDIGQTGRKKQVRQNALS